MYVDFIIPGQAKGKGRPRMAKTGIVYTPKPTLIYENFIKQIYMTECKGCFFDQDTALKLEITVTHAIPKRLSKTKRQQILDGSVHPLTKPDLDNIIKIIMDALCGIAYKDDKQIVQIQANRIYGERAYVKVRLGGINGH